MNPDSGLTRWFLDNLVALLTVVIGAFAGAFAWLVRNISVEIQVRDRLTALELSLKNHKIDSKENAEKTLLAFMRADARFDILGGEFRDYREKAAERFASRNDLQKTEAHLRELLSLVGQQVEKVGIKVDERMDKLYDAVMSQKRGGN